ncbi:MAG: hypothetical protein ACLR78_00590 [Roseburia sp.]
MKTTGGFKLWQIIYPIGIYYVVSSLMYFVLGLFWGWATDLYAAPADLLGGNDPGDDEFL